MRAGGVLVTLLMTGQLSAQSWQLRVGANAQRVSYHSIAADSVPAGDVVVGPTGGYTTADGFAASCFTAAPWCHFFRPGESQLGVPVSGSVDLDMWGLGAPGLRFHLSGRALSDLRDESVWPGVDPTVRVVEGFAEYLHDELMVRLGRVPDHGRLGNASLGAIDGMRAAWLFEGTGVEVGGYGGWGLARGTTLPVTAPAVNPLFDFRPRDRQLVFGSFVSLRSSNLSGRVEYRREVDPETDYFVAERASASLQFGGWKGVRVESAADLDLAQGQLGNSELTLRYSSPGVSASIGGRFHRPFFDLWTVWGAFSPSPYRGLDATLGVVATPWLSVGGSAGWFRYDDTETSTPNVKVEDSGNRLSVAATLTPSTKVSGQLRTHREFMPGASSQGVDGWVRWEPVDELGLRVEGGTLERPLEFRYQDAGVHWLGGSADWAPSPDLRLGVSVSRYWESRERPDAASFDFNQWRLTARVSITLRSAPDVWRLPPARPVASK